MISFEGICSVLYARFGCREWIVAGSETNFLKLFAVGVVSKVRRIKTLKWDGEIVKASLLVLEVIGIIDSLTIIQWPRRPGVMGGYFDAALGTTYLRLALARSHYAILEQ